MKTSRGIMFFAVAVVWVLMAFSAMAGDPGKDVNIVNTNSNPVPITGDIGITGTANVNLINTEKNPLPINLLKGNIGITGTANVNLTNTEKNPLPVNLVKETIPFSISSYCNVSSQSTACEVRDDLKVDAGMRAVILFAQCHVEAVHKAPETRAVCMIQDVTSPLPGDPSTGFRAVPTLSLAPISGHFGVASLSTHMVFTGKSLASGRIYPPDGATIGLSSIRFTLSGYFEPN